jgi:hypothetical protein
MSGSGALGADVSDKNYFPTLPQPYRNQGIESAEGAVAGEGLSP